MNKKKKDQNFYNELSSIQVANRSDWTNGNQQIEEIALFKNDSDIQ